VEYVSKRNYDFKRKRHTMEKASHHPGELQPLQKTMD
jgi:hypothetical protein